MRKTFTYWALTIFGSLLVLAAPWDVELVELAGGPAELGHTAAVVTVIVGGAAIFGAEPFARWFHRRGHR
jgi:hypothetical protein